MQPGLGPGAGRAHCGLRRRASGNIREYGAIGPEDGLQAELHKTHKKTIVKDESLYNWSPNKNLDLSRSASKLS